MRVIETKLPGVLLFETSVYRDSRGFFEEIFRNQNLPLLGDGWQFVQDNHSKSSKGVLRGLHYQVKNPQGKFITVVEGEIMDVAVDLRKKSKTFGQHVSINMKNDSNFSIYIPEGFAHGFVCLSKTCTVYYRCTNYRHKQTESTLRWNDPVLNINWKVKKPILSKKDKNGLNLSYFK